jgi:Cu/Ag efflux protein CusF
LLGACLWLLAPVASWSAPEYDRGTIMNLDLKAMQVQIKDAKDRLAVWKVAKDATVKFTDKAWENRSPKLQDLRPQMYVHFQFDGATSTIQSFDVKDVGPGSAAPATPPPAGSNSAAGSVTAIDLKVAQVEITQMGARKTYQAANAGVLRGLKAGDYVTLSLESRNGQDVVVSVKRGR